MPTTLVLGQWKSFLFPTSLFAKNIIKQMQEAATPFFFTAPPHTSEPTFLIISSPPIPNEQFCPIDFPVGDQSALKQFNRDWISAYLDFLRAQKLQHRNDKNNAKRFTFSWPESLHHSTHPPKSFRNEIKSRNFACIVIEKKDDPGKFGVWLYCLYLANLWHTFREGLCLHSAAIILRQQGFLFLGKSKSGKSTVTSLGISMGYEALGDDLNFLYFDKEYHLASGPSMLFLPGTCSTKRPLLRGIFVLVQDYRDFLMPLSSIQAAQAIFESFMQTPSSFKLPEDSVSRSFKTISKISRDIPAYELHFRNSPDFLRLIDERFSE